MGEKSLTLFAMCATLLWAGLVYARPVAVSHKGGLPACEASLNLCTEELATCNSVLSSPSQLCGNDMIDPGEQCDQGNLNGQTCASEGFAGGTLKCGANCRFDTSGCSNPRFVDNGDGTITDEKTGLMWEKTTGTGGNINFVNNTYTWSTGEYVADGTAFTSFLTTLNNGASTDGRATTPITGCFAKHCDWRLPSIVELQGIVDTSATGCGSANACIDPIFGPTQASFYYSATTDAKHPTNVWGVDFQDGTVVSGIKGGTSLYVRAVRGGS